MGRSVDVVVSLPTLMGLGATVAASDLIATVSEVAAGFLATKFPIAVHPLPIALPEAQFYQCWHERFDEDPAHAWLRTLIARTSMANAAEKWRAEGL